MPSFDYASLPKSPIACPVCDGDEFRTLCRTDRYLMGLATAHCQGCGLVMTNPCPDQSALDEFYKVHYRTYYRKLESPDYSYVRRYSLDRRAEYTVAHLTEQGLLQTGARVLDVGCGEGSILRQIRIVHPRVQTIGVEMYPPFARFAAEYAACPIYPSLDQLPASLDPRFDLVILSHVLEHVPQPVRFLSMLKGHLKPGGTLFIDVPDVTHYHWLADLHIAHIHHFSPHTLAAAARRAGLAVHSIQAHKPPKLPWCVRIACGAKGDSIALPADRSAEQAAAQRIARMGRFAPLFAACFFTVMAVYEWSWSFWSRISPRHRRRTSNHAWTRLEPMTPAVGVAKSE